MDIPPFNWFSFHLELYELKSTCYYNSTMPFCPVLVRVADDLQKYYDGFKYLLQVWDEK
jgi:hypothetical protein